MAAEPDRFKMVLSRWLPLLMGVWVIGCAPSFEDPRWELERSVALDSMGAIMAVAAQSPGLLVAGGMMGQIATSSDTGKTWSISRVQANDSSHFRAVALPEKGAVFAVSAGQPALIYKSVDTGLTWRITHRDSTGMAFLDALHFFNGVKGMVYGDAIEGASHFLITEDSGESWRRLPEVAFNPPHADDHGFAASNSLISSFGRRVWVASSDALWHSSNYGDTWTQTPLPHPESWDTAEVAGWMGVQFYDENRGVMVGGDWNQPSNSTGTVLIYNGEWSQCVQCPGHVADALYVPGMGGGVLLAAGQSGIWQSVDGGINWSLILDEPVYTLSSNALGDVLIASSKNQVHRLVRTR